MRVEGRWGRPDAAAVACYAVAILLILYAWWPLTSANWSIVDDHEIVATAGPLNDFSYTNIPAALDHTEVSGSSTMTRFRPSYYVLRMTEIATWGAQPTYWYAARIGLFIAFAASFTWLCLRITTPLLSFGFVVFVFSRHFWVDIFARLGPAEAYGALGLALIFVGVLRDQKVRWGAWQCLALALGVVIAAGSKENFLFLAVLPLWVLVTRWRTLTWLNKGLLSLPVCFAAWVAATVVVRIGSNGKDIYAQDVTLDSRLSLLIHLVSRLDVWAWCLGGALLLAAVAFLKPSRGTDLSPALSSLRAKLWGYFWCMAGLLLVFSLQYLFYAGRWPETGNPRYMFPGILAKYLAMLVFAAALYETILVTSAKKWAARTFAVGATLLFLGVIQFPHRVGGGSLPYEIRVSQKGFLPDLMWNRASAKKVADESARFAKGIAEGVAALKQHTSMVVVLNTHNALDYEPVFSVERYLRAASIQAPIAVRFDGFTVDSFPDDPLARELTQVMDDVRNGRTFNQQGVEYPAPLQNLFVPLERLDLSTGCFSFGFSGPPFAGCVRGVQIFP